MPKHPQSEYSKALKRALRLARVRSKSDEKLMTSLFFGPDADEPVGLLAGKPLTAKDESIK